MNEPSRAYSHTHTHMCTSAANPVRGDSKEEGQQLRLQSAEHINSLRMDCRPPLSLMGPGPAAHCGRPGTNCTTRLEQGARAGGQPIMARQQPVHFPGDRQNGRHRDTLHDLFFNGLQVHPFSGNGRVTESCVWSKAVGGIPQAH